jgi:hypothetical protein
VTAGNNSVVGPEGANGNPEKGQTEDAVSDRLPGYLGYPGREVVGKETRGVMGQDERVFDHGRSR